MTEINAGVRSLLKLPRLYEALQRLVGEHAVKTEFVDRYVRVGPGQRLLDIGCGTGRMLAYLPDVEYFGFDPNPAYIEKARASFGDRGTFTCSDVASVELQGVPRCHVAIALAVLHHLDDESALRLFELAAAHMEPGGRLLTLDSCLVPGQSAVARFLIDRDRGQNTRTEEGYVALARTVFSNVRSTVRHDLARIPYTHIILECS